MASCPRLRFVKKQLTGEAVAAVRIEAYGEDRKKLIGAITITRWERKDEASTVPRGVPYISHVEVNDKMRRCGVATALYQQAGEIACRKFKAPLRSDRERSAAADTFWQKQVEKGRARCIKAAKESLRHNDGPMMGRNNCDAYELMCPAPKSLDRIGYRRHRSK
jgi:hypothetical protein